MAITKEQLVAKRDAFQQALKQIESNFNATQGAIGTLDELIAQLESEEVPASHPPCKCTSTDPLEHDKDCPYYTGPS